MDEKFEALRIRYLDYFEFLKAEVLKTLIRLNTFCNNYLPMVYNTCIIILAELVGKVEAFLSVLYVMCIDLVPFVAVLLFILYLFDRTNLFLRQTFGPEIKKDVPETYPLPLNCVERGVCFLAMIWPMAELFMWAGELIDQFPILKAIEDDLLRGTILFVQYSPLNSTLIGLFVYKDIIRRRGPDTIWRGPAEFPEFWIKYTVRYHWCYAFSMHILIGFFMWCYLKLVVGSAGLRAQDQEVWMTAFFFITFTLILYGGVCAIFGIQCKLPIYDGACRIHCGIPKRSTKD